MSATSQTTPASPSDGGLSIEDDLLFEVAASTADDSRKRAVLNQIVERYLDFAHRQAAHYAGRCIPLDDLRQVAAVALTCAAQRFDPSKGRDSRPSLGRPCAGSCPSTSATTAGSCGPRARCRSSRPGPWSALEELLQQLGRAPTPHELADHLGEPREQVIEALTADGCFVPLSLDHTVDRTEDVPLGETLVSPEDPYRTAELRAMIGSAVRALKPRDQQILMLRFFAGLTQAEIAERLGSTPMTVSRILSHPARPQALGGRGPVVRGSWSRACRLSGLADDGTTRRAGDPPREHPAPVALLDRLVAWFSAGHRGAYVSGKRRIRHTRVGAT